MTNNANLIEQELNKIRIEIYNETKDLSIDERKQRAFDLRKKLSKKYNFKVVQKV